MDHNFFNQVTPQHLITPNHTNQVVAHVFPVVNNPGVVTPEVNNQAAHNPALESPAHANNLAADFNTPQLHFIEQQFVTPEGLNGQNLLHAFNNVADNQFEPQFITPQNLFNIQGPQIAALNTPADDGLTDFEFFTPDNLNHFEFFTP